MLQFSSEALSFWSEHFSLFQKEMNYTNVLSHFLKNSSHPITAKRRYGGAGFRLHGSERATVHPSRQDQGIFQRPHHGGQGGRAEDTGGVQPASRRQSGPVCRGQHRKHQEGPHNG